MISILELLNSSGRRIIVREFLPLNDVYPELTAQLLLKYRRPTDIKSPRFCGIEVEVEGCAQRENVDALYAAEIITQVKKETSFTYEAFNKFWKTTKDGSLREGGLEYVTQIGTTFALAQPMLRMFEHRLSIVEAEARANARTGLHVHVDVRDFKLIDLQRLLTVYLVFEKALFAYSGDRKTNVFCVPLAETKLPLFELPTIHSLTELRRFITSNASKYMSLNLEPLLTQGTIEFRMHKGSIKAEEIGDWLHILSDLVSSVDPQLHRLEHKETLLTLLTSLSVEEISTSLAQWVFKDSYQLVKPFITEENIKYGVEKALELYVQFDKIPDEFCDRKPKKRGIDRLDFLGMAFGEVADIPIANPPMEREANEVGFEVLAPLFVNPPLDEIKESLKQQYNYESLAEYWSDETFEAVYQFFVTDNPRNVDVLGRVRIERPERSWWCYQYPLLSEVVVHPESSILVYVPATKKYRQIKAHQQQETDIFLKVVSHYDANVIVEERF